MAKPKRKPGTKAKTKPKHRRVPVARNARVAARTSDWERLERSRREVFDDFCNEHGVAPEKLEHVYRDTMQDWLAAANEVLAPEGRRIFYAEPRASGWPEQDEEADDSWSDAKSPSEWKRLFKRSVRTLNRRIEAGTLRVKKLTSKAWQVHVDDLPQSMKLPTK